MAERNDRLRVGDIIIDYHYGSPVRWIVIETDPHPLFVLFRDYINVMFGLWDDFVVQGGTEQDLSKVFCGTQEFDMVADKRKIFFAEDFKVERLDKLLVSLYNCRQV